MNLSDKQCKSAKPKDKPYKLSDSGGLYLQITPSGSKYWRLKYRFHNKEKLLSIGVYPAIGLLEAREKREQAKKLLRENIDPADAKRELKLNLLMAAKITFKSVALEWHENQSLKWTDNYKNEVLNRLERDIFPQIGDRQMSKIDAPELLQALRKIESRNALDLVRRVKALCGQIFRYGIATGKCKYNPVPDLKGALKTRKTEHFASIEPKNIPELLEAIEKNAPRLFARTIRAIKMSMFTFVRPGELQKAVWDEFDFVKKEWRIPANRMKSRQEHIVPLSRQVIAILEEQKAETGNYDTPYVFPSLHKPAKPLSDNTVRMALHRLGFKDRMTAHGFRALARTAIREELNYDADIIEVQLAHKPAGPLGAAYDRTKFIKQRHPMMQKWADYLDTIAYETMKKKIIYAKFKKE